jgi:predicted nucleic acid-binding protein
VILYLDTSALVKRYFQESYSGDVADLWKRASEIVISSVGYAEALCAFYRKKREARLGDRAVISLINTFQADWSSFIRVAVSDQLNVLVDALVSRHALRGFDVIHLASALTVKKRLKEDFLFCCFDDRLATVANREGLETFSR